MSVDPIQEIKDRADIVELISGIIPVKKSGANYVAICPFHNDTKPSMHISSSKGIFKCFACGAGGDVFKFWSDYYQKDFKETLKELAQKYGVELTNSSTNKEEIEHYNLQIRMHELAAKYYNDQLLGSEQARSARNYLEERKISTTTISEYQLGYSPADPENWGKLITLLQDKLNVTEAQIVEAGLALQSEKNSRYFDRFRGRLMIPIRDERGRVIAFGARLVPGVENDNGPKYLNSPDTQTYHKGETLFGIDLAKEFIRKEDGVIIVEGYFDQIALFQAGIKNVLANQGTALTAKQVKTMSDATAPTTAEAKAEPKFIATIGLEIHAELKTESKMFCSCKNDPDEEKPNVNICPICMGHPGTLPVLNKQAIKHVLHIGHAVNGSIAGFTEWDRKHYFYPDIPKAYQITQYKYPLVSNGRITVGSASAPAHIDITRIHLEEDTARSTHDQGERSLVDYNRSGVPLMELVTEPVIHDAATAVAFAKELQLLLRYLGAGEANMEKGEMRVEANISVASPENTKARKFGTKTEVKNLNSFRAVERAIAFEIERQIKAIEKGEAIVQETRGWSDATQKTFSQRAKESSHDYRYFPDPDIPKMDISNIAEFAPENIKKEMPELPWEKRARFIGSFGMTDKEAHMCVDNPKISAYFEAVASSLSGDTSKIRLATNYILSDYVGLIKKDRGEDIESGIDQIPATDFAGLIQIVSKGDVSSKGAKGVLAILYASKGGDAASVAKENGLVQTHDEGAIRKAVGEIIAQNPNVVADYKAGKAVALQFFVGQGMKATKGAANPELLKKIILSELDKPAI